MAKRKTARVSRAKSHRKSTKAKKTARRGKKVSHNAVVAWLEETFGMAPKRKSARKKTARRKTAKRSTSRRKVASSRRSASKRKSASRSRSRRTKMA